MRIPNHVLRAARAIAKIANGEDDVLVTTARAAGFPVLSLTGGAYKSVLVGRRYCIKICRHSTPYHHNDARFIAEKRRTRHRRYFPKIRRITAKVCVQERCPPNWCRYRKNRRAIETLARCLGLDLIDIHWQNVGFRRGRAPVFFDCGIR